MTEMVIRSDDGLVTLINTFEVEASKQEELVALLNEGLEKVFRHRPGFVSAAILASKDGGKVVNYAQWRSPDDIQATLADPAAQEYGKRSAALAKPAPQPFSVASVYTAS